MYEKFFFSKCFEFTGETMYTVVMKNIFPLRYEIHLTVGIWIYNSFSRREKEMVRNVHA